MSTCRSAITCFSDLLLTIGDTVENPTQRQNMMSQIIHYRNTLFDSIFASLVSSEVPRDIKPDLFSCLSCMFWELSDYCLVLVERCLTSTFGAADYPVEELESDDDWEWADRLYCAVVEVWDAMNMAVARNGEPIRQAFPRMMEFACRVTMNDRSSPQLIRSTLLMIQDLATALGSDGCQGVGARGVGEA